MFKIEAQSAIVYSTWIGVNEYWESFKFNFDFLDFLGFLDCDPKVQNCFADWEQK